MVQQNFDVIIIGAGASGLMAAWELVQAGKTVGVVEARERIGGRIHTIEDSSFELPVELGAEFIHGKLEITELLLKKSGTPKYKIMGDIWQKHERELEEQNDFIEDYSAINKKFKELKKDISVAEFISDHLNEDKFVEARFTLKNYVEGYYAADTNKASTFSLREELSQGDGDQYRVEGGYKKLVDYLWLQCSEKGARLFLSHPVNEIQWSKDKVTIAAGKNIFSGKKVLVTVPMGVLQSERIRFTPALPEQMAAARHLGFGPVIKTMLQFETAFWKDRELTGKKDLDKLSFIFSRSTIPTWWSYYPKDAAMLTGWSGGPHAHEIRNLDDTAILQKALESLSGIFHIDVAQLQKILKAWHVSNWQDDPYSCGGYSYEVVDGKAAKKILLQPVENSLFFAGEGLIDGIEIGTVEGALKNGREMGQRIIASF